MSDKTSQRTEEEMLDQTFVGYDEEMTVQTEDAAKDNSSSTPAAAPDKKKNQNLLVYGAMGLAAVGFLGFKFLGGDSAPQQQVQEPIQPTQQPQTVETPQQVQTPVVAATTEPVPVPAQPQVVVPTPVPVTPEQSATVTPTPATTVDPVAQYTGNTTSASLPKVETVPEVKPEVKVEVQPVTPVPVPVNVEKVTAVTTSNAEASSSNDKLLSQFQEMLDRKYDPQFKKIEKSLDEQKEVNKSIEERLARLEAGKPTKATVKSSNDESTTETKEAKPVKKIVRKPVVIKRKVESKVQNRTTRSDDGEVLIDRTSVKSKPEIQKIDPVYPKMEIHSVYSGRIWTKNADGTLSTFAVGDKLPTGEVIKKIDEDKERVTTDKRVISQ